MFQVRLERVRELSASTRDYRFVRTDGALLEYKPGQFFRFVFVDEQGEFERSYSLCNYDELFGAHLDLVISRVEGGRATRLLFDCEAGLDATVTGPFGRLVLPEVNPHRLVMVATSVGLAPYMPILRQLEENPPPEVVLLLGVRDRSEFIYGDELLDYASRHDWFELKLCLSREPARADHEYGGYVTEQLTQLAPDPEADHFLLCGNPNMIDDVFSRLKDGGFKPRQVVREKYVFAREKSTRTTSLTDEQKRLIAEKAKKYS